MSSLQGNIFKFFSDPHIVQSEQAPAHPQLDNPYTNSSDQESNPDVDQHTTQKLCSIYITDTIPLAIKLLQSSVFTRKLYSGLAKWPENNA